MWLSIPTQIWKIPISLISSLLAYIEVFANLVVPSLITLLDIEELLIKNDSQFEVESAWAADQSPHFGFVQELNYASGLPSIKYFSLFHQDKLLFLRLLKEFKVITDEGLWQIATESLS